MKRLTWDKFVQLIQSYALFTSEEDGNWTVEIPVLPGCVTWGENRLEAAVMAKDAVEGWLLMALRFGDEIPTIDGYSLNYLTDYQPDMEMAYA